MTNTANTIDSEMPSAVQSSTGVKPIWLFYSSDVNSQDLDIYALQSSGIYPVHDVAVSGTYGSSSLGTKWEYPGGLRSVSQTAIVTITVAIANVGDYVENVIVALSVTNTTVISVGSLHSMVGPGNIMNFYFYWNTTNVVPAQYGVSVSITPLSGETLGNMGDNSYGLKNVVHVIPLGDVDQDGSVTLTDISVFFYDYGFSASCNCSRWNPYADIHGTGVIDIVDVGVASKNYDIFA